MDNNIYGKKLMLLGGVRPACEIINEAHRYGVVVYETDYLTDSPAKKVADKSFMTSCTDVDAVVDLCRREGVDGVFTGYTDSLLPYAEQICKKLGVPFWGNAENIAMSIDKKLFKIACEKSGLPVVPWKLVNITNYKSELQNVQLPAVLKPVDNSGGRGIYKCYNQEDLIPLCEQSFTFSKSKEVIVERLMDAHNEISAYYIMNHGDVYLTGLGDKYVVEVDKNLVPVSSSLVMPSIRLEQWIKEMDPIVKKFFKDNKMNDGYVFLQGFYEDQRFYIHEMGYRLNGGFTFKLVEHFCGYNQIQQLLKYSLTGSMDKVEIAKSDPHLGGGKGMGLEISLKKGVIGKIEGVDEVRKLPGVLYFYQLKDVGAELTSNSTTAQVFADVFLASNTVEEIKQLIRDIGNIVKVYDVKGNDMLQPLLDPEDIHF